MKLEGAFDGSPLPHEITTISCGLLFDSIQVYIWNKGFWAMAHKYHEVSKAKI
jgi:hypothetical protein